MRSPCTFWRMFQLDVCETNQWHLHPIQADPTLFMIWAGYDDKNRSELQVGKFYEHSSQGICLCGKIYQLVSRVKHLAVLLLCNFHRYIHKRYPNTIDQHSDMKTNLDNVPLPNWCHRHSLACCIVYEQWMQDKRHQQEDQKDQLIHRQATLQYFSPSILTRWMILHEATSNNCQMIVHLNLIHRIGSRSSIPLAHFLKR